MDNYFHGLTEHAEQQKEKKEIDYAEVQKKFGWRVILALSKRQKQ